MVRQKRPKSYLVELMGLEPMTSCMPCKRSSQLSYSPTTSTLCYSFRQWLFAVDCSFRKRLLCPKNFFIPPRLRSESLRQFPGTPFCYSASGGSASVSFAPKISALRSTTLRQFSGTPFLLLLRLRRIRKPLLWLKISSFLLDSTQSTIISGKLFTFC